MHKNIQASPVRLYFVKQAVQIIHVPHVGLDEHCSTAILLDLVDCGPGRFAIPEEIHDYVSPTGREVERYGSSDPSPGSGDERDPAFEFPT
jgi:hypothetical protein